MENSIKDKLYLNPLQTNTFRKKLNPIRQKILLSSSLNSNASKSVTDVLRGLNGSIIMQNWNTKNKIPSDIGELINCPTIIDKKKIANLKRINVSEIINKQEEKLILLDKIRKKKSEEKTIQIKKLEMLNESIKKGEFKKILIQKDIFRNKIDKRSISSFLTTRKEEGKSHIATLPLTERSIIKIKKTSKNKISKTEGFIKINKIKKSRLIDFSTFKSYLFLKENDFLYAKRVGGPYDYVLCSYHDINPNFSSVKFKSKVLIDGNYTSQSCEYLTISKNTILHYRRGVPHLYTINDWINDYLKYKQLMKIPLIKNFKDAKLFELWKRYYRKKTRVFYCEKFKKKTIFVEPHLLKGILEIRKIYKDMTFYELFKLNIPSPVFLNKFNQIHADILNINYSHLDRYRARIKREISNACRSAYFNFKKEKNITLEDPVINEEEGQNDEQNLNKNKNEGSFLLKDDKSAMNAFLKDSVPYAQDATRKRYFKKLLKYIRLIDILFGYCKIDLIKNSLQLLGKRFARAYECYLNQWNDIPILIIMIVTLGDQISYSPAVELIRAAFFDNFIQENINQVVNLKTFLNPEEFPQYMICFEEVFDITVDQNGALNVRIKEDNDIKSLIKNIKISFGNCHKALEETALSLTPSLINYNKFTKLDFNQIEAKSNHNDLNNYIKMFKEEGDVVVKYHKKINIGIFEFNQELFLEQIVDVPFNYMKKIFMITPKILDRKMDELKNEIEGNYNSINFNVPNKNIELFIKLKKAVEHCASKKAEIEDKVDEIQELNNIIVSHKEIKFEDFERRKYDFLTGLRTNYERKMDSMNYFIEQNIKQFKADLMSKIKKYDEMVQKIHEELDEEQINKYSEDTDGPIMLLEEKSFRIIKAMNDKKLFQQQEIDIDMEENNRSNFENLDFVKYDYDLKMSIWKNLNEYKIFISSVEKQQIMEIELQTFEQNIANWKKICIVAKKDLVGSEVANEFLSKVIFYEKICHILKIIHNDNIQKVDYLKDLVKNALGLSGIDFSDSNFTLEKLINTNGIFDSIPILDEINLRANEEFKIKEIYKSVQESLIAHHIPLKVKLDSNEKANAKYIISFEDFDKEQEYIENNLSKLNKELMNPYISVIESDFRVIVNNVYKYQLFLDTYYEYQIYMLNVDELIFNSEFAKEMPTEFKKLSNESLTKTLVRTLKDCIVLNKYIEYGHERTINTLRLLINNYEQNFKSIRTFLQKKRKDFQDYYLLNDEELISLIIHKDSYEIRKKLLLKLLPFIESIDPGKETDENIKFVTKEEKEEVIIKYHKTTRTLRDGLECIDLGLSKKIKDFFKNFKKNFDNIIKSKTNTKPISIIFDLITNKDNINKNNNLNQLIFISAYHVFFFSLEKTLEKEKEAFDKLFDFYNELKDIEKVYTKMIKEENNTINRIKVLISIIAIINYFIKSIENLVREDVTKTSDYPFYKILQIKIENDFVNIKILNFNFEYGNEYTGLKYDFFVLPDTEKTFLSIVNALYYRKPFLLYNNQSFFKKEILNITSNILGKNISYFTSNKAFNVTGLNNVIYGNMRNGNLVCINNTELIEFNLLKVIIERINEIFRLIQSKHEEGYFTDRNNEKYSINIKKFNIFLTYNIDSFNFNNRNYILPLCVKTNFRNIGINYINFYSYVTLIMNSYKINRANEIASKIKFIIDALIFKGNLFDKKNLKEKIFPYLFDKLKDELIIKIKDINKKNVNEIIKKSILKIISPFLNANKIFKEDIKTLINITLFDYEESEKNNLMKNNKKVIKKISVEKVIKPEDSIYEETFKKFSFDKNYYIEKIKNLYSSLKNRNSFVLLGPCLSGKSNALIYLKEISMKLNKINSDNYPNFSYVKIYPNYKNYDDVFISNNVMAGYQANNIYFKNMINFLELGGKFTTELHEHYKKLFFIANNVINEENTNNLNDKISNEYKSIVFDGSLSFEWCSFLINYLDENKKYTLYNGDFINLAEKKIIFETTILSKATPSFITKQNIILFDYESFDWLNIFYAYLETNYKTSKNEELKLYIKGLFENYLPKIIEFIINNKLKNIDFCINKNFIVKNVINLFDAFLPDFDFTDIKIGRRNYDYVPRIEIVKNQTLSIFIFCSAWIMNLLTNFLIKNKIEKAVGDIFKSDDLKGPIFDYYLDENNSFALWNTIFNEEKYPNPSFKKNTVYYYGHNFVYNIENFKYIYIFQKMVQSSIPIFFFAKKCSGLSSIINKSLEELEDKHKLIKQIKFKMTYDTDTNYLEKEINSKMDKILRRVYGDKFQRQTLIFIDDVHLCGKRNNFNEYMRYLLNEHLTYDNKDNMIIYYQNLNVVNSGNYFNNLLENNHNDNHTIFDESSEKEDFSRYMNQFSLITLNLSQPSYISIYKPTMEFHFRTYIPNISNIISNQYLTVLFKINELLNEEIKYNYSNIHYFINLRDITKIIQQFNKFIFRGTTEYTEYLKKLFLYESYCLYSDKFNNESDLEIFKKILIKSFNSSFKQDKLELSIFNQIDKDSSFIYCKNFLDVYEENKKDKYVDPKNLEFVYVEKKSDFKKFIVSKIKSFYGDFYFNGGVKGTEDINYIINDYNDYMINTVIRLLRILDSEYPNIILIGSNFSGKEILVRIALYIMRYNYVNININKLLNKTKEIFEEESIIKTLADVVFNNKKIFLIFQHDIFNNLNEEKQVYIFELISSLLDPNIILEKYKSFMKVKSDKEHYYNLDQELSFNEMRSRIKNNLQFIISINYEDYTYRTLFLNYPNIVNNFYTLYVKNYDDNKLQTISENIFRNCGCNPDTIKCKNILLDIYNYAKLTYESFSKKINIEIPINQRNYMNVCEFFSKKYKPYKEILIKKRDNYNKIFTNIKKINELVEEKQKLIADLMPSRENNDKIIEEKRKQITLKNADKNKIKEKRKDEDKLLKIAEKEKDEKVNKLGGILHPSKELIRKIAANIAKFNEKDIVDCKNTWENFQFGKFLFQKLFLFLGDANGNDYDYIKKNISPKQFKRFINMDYSKKINEFNDLIKEIMEHPDYGGLEKYNKNFKLAGLLCEYVLAVKKYYKVYNDNFELRDEIQNLQKDIEERKLIINKHEEEFKGIDKEIDNLQIQIDNLETTKSNIVNQLDKYRILVNGYNTFIETTKENEEMWKSKKEEIENILKYFDYYMIFISSYANYATILNYTNRQKLKNYILQIINEYIEQFSNSQENQNMENKGEDEKENKLSDLLYIKDINFVELMYNILDVVGKEKELFTSSNIYKNFIRENFILMHIFKEKNAFILDYTHYAKQILTEYLEFSKIQNIQIANITTNPLDKNQDFKDKLLNCIKNGGNLFLDGVPDINNIYYYFYDYINKKFTGDKYKKLVLIDDHKYELNDSFKLYIFKNTIEKSIMKVDQNIFFNMLLINFNLSKEDIKDQIFIELGKKRNEAASNSFKKLRNDLIKQSLSKLETENKMINSILQLDISGNVDKLQSNESINEKYKTECQLYSKINTILKKYDISYKKQKLAFDDNYGKLSRHSSILFKWIFKFNLTQTMYLINPETLIKYLLEFYDEKILLQREHQENERKKIKEEQRKIKPFGETEESNLDYLESQKEEKEEDNEESIENNEVMDENIEKINPVIKEEFIYNTNEDIKALFIFFYNKINKIYTDKDLNISFLMLLSILCFNFQNKNQISFKNLFNNYYLSHKEFDELIDKEDLKEPPIENISIKQWTLVDKINTTCGDIFQNIINNIEENKEKWNIYLNENIEGNVENHYYLNDMVLPDNDLEQNTNSIIKFLFFLTVKPNKKEFIINQFIQNTFKESETDDEIIEEAKNKKKKKNIEYISKTLIENYDNYDLITSFRNFDLKKDNALVLTAPSNAINIYDSILYNNCYLKMFIHGSSEKNQSKLLDAISSNNEIQNLKGNSINNANSNKNNENNKENTKTLENEGNQPAQGMPVSNEIKYKEIILENSDLTQQDYDFIKNNIKLGTVIIVKYAEYLGNYFSELIKEIFNYKTEEISHNFKLILICSEGEVLQNKLIYEKCKIIAEKKRLDEGIEDLPDKENKTIKKIILNNICKISNDIYNKLINNNNIYMRLFLRKLIFNYILLFGVLQKYPLNNPFYFSNKDFHCLCQFTIKFVESELQNEEKYKDFMNIENNTGYNYQSLFQILNNIFIFSRQINIEDKFKVIKLVNYIIDLKNFMMPDFYLNINDIQIKISQLPIENDIMFKDIYKSFDCIYSSKFESCILVKSQSEIIDNQINYGNQILQNLFNIMNTNINIGESISNNFVFNMDKIHQILLKFEENIPYDIPYLIKEGGVELQNGETINPSLFKKNKYGLYFNGLDESLYYELAIFNEKLIKIHNEISNIIRMAKGELNYKIEFWEIFNDLSNNKVPPILNIYNNISFLNIPLNVNSYLKIIKSRISLYKEWLREGNLNYYHLPIFTNIELFIHSLKMNFCRKYYGENDFSKITPDRVTLKFIYTKYKAFKDFSSNEKVLKHYRNIYKNEIIWVDGLVLNNAFISENGKIKLDNKENNVKNRMNVVGITYTIEQYFEENISESESNSVDGDEEESESKENENILEEKKNIIDKKIKIYIYGNDAQCLNNKYYDNEAIGFMEFESDEKFEKDFIYENNIKITVEDLDDFI